MLAAVSNYGRALEWASPSLQDDEEVGTFVLFGDEGFSCNICDLTHDIWLHMHVQVVFAAVTNDRSALDFAARRLQLTFH